MDKRVGDNVTVLPLLEGELTNNMMDVEAVSTVTIFNGQPPVDYVRDRVDEIVVHNPWLKGRLVKKKKERMTVQYSASAELSHFQLVDHIRMERHHDLNTSIIHLGTALKTYFVKKPKDCVNKDEPQFSVVMGAINPEQYFLFMSLSHILGDGHTFYKIYGMLSGEVQALTGERDLARGNQITVDSKEMDDVFTSPAILLSMGGKYLFGKRINQVVREVNMEHIQQCKAAYAAKAAEASSTLPPFISTNDIITSQYLAACNCDLGLMAINYRNRKEGLTDSLAGNYESLLPYQKGDYEAPELIRESLKSFKRRNADTPLLNGFFRKFNAGLSIITNWCSFYSEVELPNSSHVAHFPAGADFDQNFMFNFCVIFMVSKDRPAVLSIEHPQRPVMTVGAMSEMLIA
mmetsp:Transcript_11031/g.18007  ORF Transcript_11031/g.18007 Transcript_11031/m.18007 type:complete len:404 (-) Transcript_11031:102-1313(-)